MLKSLPLRMKSFMSVFGAFLFSIFLEGFIRIIIFFYHQTELNFFGISKLPDFSWIYVIYISVGIISWLSGMLAVSFAGFSPKKHLLALASLFFIWRLNEIIQTFNSEPQWYIFTIPFVSFLGLFLAYKTQNIKDEKTTS